MNYTNRNDRVRPSSQLTVREARDLFLAQNGLDASTYTAPRFVLHLGAWSLVVPNPGMLPLHDLHHVATGFGSGLAGEAEISAFELRTGWGNPLILILCIGAVLLGATINPRRVLRAWSKASGAHGLYHCMVEYERLLEMTVEELRSYLSIPPDGIAMPYPPAQESRIEKGNHP